jgi:hypothetical protein
MNIISGYIHPVRVDIDYKSFLVPQRVTTSIKIETYVMAIKDENIIDSFGIRSKLSAINKLSNDEIAGLTTEIRIIFSNVESIKEDRGLMEIVLSDCYVKTLEYWYNELPSNVMDEEKLEQLDFKELSGEVLVRLVEYGLYG